MTTKRTKNSASSILHRRYYEGNEARKAELEKARESAKVSRQIFQLRKEAGLTQQQLADRIETPRSAIARLEDDDYEGHSLSMLRRIAKALNRRVEVHFVPIDAEKHPRA